MILCIYKNLQVRKLFLVLKYPYSMWDQGPISCTMLYSHLGKDKIIISVCVDRYATGLVHIIQSPCPTHISNNQEEADLHFTMHSVASHLVQWLKIGWLGMSLLGLINASYGNLNWSQNILFILLDIGGCITYKRYHKSSGSISRNEPLLSLTINLWYFTDHVLFSLLIVISAYPDD